MGLDGNFGKIVRRAALAASVVGGAASIAQKAEAAPQTSVPKLEQVTPESEKIQSDFVHQIENADKITIGNLAVESNYALLAWGDENKGGDALLHRNQAGEWICLSMGGGLWDVPSLVTMGVPKDIAEKLVEKNPQ